MKRAGKPVMAGLGGGILVYVLFLLLRGCIGF